MAQLSLLGIYQQTAPPLRHHVAVIGWCVGWVDNLRPGAQRSFYSSLPVRGSITFVILESVLEKTNMGPWQQAWVAVDGLTEFALPPGLG